MTALPVSVEAFRFSYRKRKKICLKNINLAIPAGRFTLVLGANGSGKSTFLRAISGLLLSFYKGEWEGTVKIDATDVRKIPQTSRPRIVQFIHQSPILQVIQDNVEKEIELSLACAGFSSEKIPEAVDETLNLFNLNHCRKKALRECSGGEVTQIALASAFAIKPAVLLLDEPLAFLDGQSRNRFVRSLSAIKGTATVIMAAHALEGIWELTDDIIFLKDGLCLFYGSKQDFLSNPLSNEVELPSIIRFVRFLKDNEVPITDSEAVELLKCTTVEGRV